MSKHYIVTLNALVFLIMFFSLGNKGPVLCSKSSQKIILEISHKVHDVVSET